MSETTNQQVVNWARAQNGKQVRKGECWDLADAALRQAGAKSSADLGPMDEDADYVWGDAVSDLKDVQAGDILQFRDFPSRPPPRLKPATPMAVRRSIRRKVVHAAAPYRHRQRSDERRAAQDPRAEFRSRGQEGAAHSLNTKDVPAASKETQKQKSKVIVTTTITVSGTISAYRPKK